MSDFYYPVYTCNSDAEPPSFQTINQQNANTVVSLLIKYLLGDLKKKVEPCYNEYQFND